MTRKMTDDLETLLGLFDANIYMSDEVHEYLAAFSDERIAKLKEEMGTLLKNDHLGAEEFRRTTACMAKSDASAKQFFKDVYDYAFENGEEPEIADYRNR